MRVIPFGVDTDMFRPLTESGGLSSIKESVFVYFKRRKPEELDFVEKILRLHNVTYRIFTYGSYSEVDYTEYLKFAKYGIWLDASESQGFALEEALSMNVPLLVWNVETMSQEYGSSYPDFFATTVPYWDDSCGEVLYHWQDFMNIYSLFLNKLDSYRPRDFVLKELSIDACECRFLDLIREVKSIC
jgi:glycosyltransferase involved in cell wall biosynthesis